MIPPRPTIEKIACEGLIFNIEELLKKPGKPGALAIDAAESMQRVLRQMKPWMVITGCYSAELQNGDEIYALMVTRAMQDILEETDNLDDKTAFAEANKLISRAIVPFAAAASAIPPGCYERTMARKLVDAMKKYC